LAKRWVSQYNFNFSSKTKKNYNSFLAKIHCIADVDSIDKEQHAQQHKELIPFEIIPRHSEITIRDAVGGHDDEFINEMIAFAMVC